MLRDIEQLEPREVPSVTAVLSRGVLTVQGSDAAEAYRLSLSGGVVRLTVGPQAWSFPAAAVGRIEASLGGGNDNWNGLATGLKVPQVVRGGAGDDAITTGEGDDTVYGDDGNDSLIPWAGRDVVYGGAGNDWIALNSGDGGAFGYPGDVAFGGAGNDELIGGSNDALYGEAGNDSLTASGVGAVGGVYLDGGDGDDRFFARQGQYRSRDTIVGGAGYDWVVTYDSRGPGDVFEYFPPNSSIERIG